MNLNLGFNAEAKIKTEFDIQPNDLGYLLMCISDVQETVRSDLNASVIEKEYEIDLAWQQIENNLVFSATFPSVKVDATLKPAPLKGLTDDNNFSSKCRTFDTFLESLIPNLARWDDLNFIDLKDDEKLGLFGRSEFTYQPTKLERIIEPLTIKVEDRFNIKAPPTETDRYIGFVVK